MADVETRVTVTPNITLTSPPVNNSGAEAIAVALVKSSENQAASTASLISALSPAREPTMPSSAKSKTIDPLTLVLLAVIAFVLWK